MSGTNAAVLPGPTARGAVGVTGGDGQVTFTWSPPFPTPPAVTLAVQAGDGFRSARIVSNTAAQTVVEVTAAAGVTVLGIGVLAAGTPAAGVTVHAHATTT